MEKDVARNIEEQLSAFLDGELAEAELQMLVRRLEKDPAYRNTLARYAAIGSVLRQEPIPTVPGGFRSGVMAAIEDAGNAEVADAAEMQSPAPAVAAGGRRRVGALLAASVALLAVVGLYQGGTSDEVAQAVPPVAAVAEAPAERVAAPIVRTVRPQRATINRDRMTSYLVSHGEFSRTYHGPMVDSRVFAQPARFQEARFQE